MAKGKGMGLWVGAKRLQDILTVALHILLCFHRSIFNLRSCSADNNVV